MSGINFNNPPDNYPAGYAWLVAAVQSLWRRINGLSGGSGSSGVSSFNTRTGAVTLTNTDVTDALGYTPADVADLPITIIADHFDSVGNSGTLVTVLYSDSVPAVHLDTNGKKVEYIYTGTFAGPGTATKNLFLTNTGVNLIDTGTFAIASAGSWVMRAFLIRASASTIRYNVTINTLPSSTDTYSSTGTLTGLDLTGPFILLLRARAGGVGGGTNDIVATSGSVKAYTNA